MRGIVAILVMVLAVTPAAAHRLIVYAFADGAEIVVETKFSSGKIPAVGTIVLKDAAEEEIMTAPLDPSGVTRIPIPDGAEGGVIVDVSTGEGHEDYWILTPADLGLEVTR